MRINKWAIVTVFCCLISLTTTALINVNPSNASPFEDTIEQEIERINNQVDENLELKGFIIETEGISSRRDIMGNTYIVEKENISFHKDFVVIQFPNNDIQYQICIIPNDAIIKIYLQWERK